MLRFCAGNFYEFLAPTNGKRHIGNSGCGVVLRFRSATRQSICKLLAAEQRTRTWRQNVCHAAIGSENFVARTVQTGPPAPEFAFSSPCLFPSPAPIARCELCADRQALALDDRNPESHAALAKLANLDFSYFWNFSEAEDEIRKASALDPNSAYAHELFRWIQY
jgi:hypothetical protein